MYISVCDLDELSKLQVNFMPWVAMNSLIDGATVGRLCLMTDNVHDYGHVLFDLTRLCHCTSMFSLCKEKTRITICTILCLLN